MIQERVNFKQFFPLNDQVKTLTTSVYSSHRPLYGEYYSQVVYFRGAVKQEALKRLNDVSGLFCLWVLQCYLTLYIPFCQVFQGIYKGRCFSGRVAPYVWQHLRQQMFPNLFCLWLFG